MTDFNGDAFLAFFDMKTEIDSHIHALCVNLPDFHGTNLVFFFQNGKWKMENLNFFLFHPY